MSFHKTSKIMQNKNGEWKKKRNDKMYIIFVAFFFFYWPHPSTSNPLPSFFLQSTLSLKEEKKTVCDPLSSSILSPFPLFNDG